MDDNLGVTRRLKQASAPDELAAELVGIRQVTVMADGEPAELKIGK